MLIPVQLVMEATVHKDLYNHLMSEGGAHEFIQFLLLLGAIVVAIRIVCQNPEMPAWLKIWIMAGAAGCIYIAGEEISWGQHFIGWGTPEYWAALNDQNETNLHNTSSWLDQKPRLLLEIGAVVGGIFMPLIIKTRGASNFPGWMRILMPHAALGMTAALMISMKLEDGLSDIVGFPIIKRESEIGELYLYYFILMYLICLGRRLQALKPFATTKDSADA